MSHFSSNWRNSQMTLKWKMKNERKEKKWNEMKWNEKKRKENLNKTHILRSCTIHKIQFPTTSCFFSKLHQGRWWCAQVALSAHFLVNKFLLSCWLAFSFFFLLSIKSRLKIELNELSWERIKMKYCCCFFKRILHLVEEWKDHNQDQCLFS